MIKKNLGLAFVSLGLIALLGGLLFGSIAAFQFVFPGTLDSLPFYKNRPLHVSLVVAWVFLSSVGGIYYYLPKFVGAPLHSERSGRIHFYIFLFTGILILVSYFFGKFGGREYWEFPPILAIPIVISWIMFGWNYFKTVFTTAKNWPVYLWMWGTGIFFFLFTFTESYLWVLPYFRNNVVREIMVQWKANGALVGSWNMLIYGTAIFVMEKIKGDNSMSRTKIAFATYLLGLTNLMFGWAHHIYNVPTAHWIRYLSYLISMSELILLAKIIWNWKSTLSESKKDFHILSFRFLVAADIWIFLNLTLALLISIPAVNLFTHGTHITVAHSMGSMIGINTMILLASCFFIISDATDKNYSVREEKMIKAGYWIFNIFLMIFWVALIVAGAEKGIGIVIDKLTFAEVMTKINPILMVFVFSGFIMFAGILMVVIPPLKKAFLQLRK